MKSYFASRRLAGSIAGACLLLFSALSSATAQTPPSAAWIIATPGSYILSTDLSPMTANGDAIQITASGVSLDLAGHTLRAVTPGMGRGIVVQNAKGVHITNGSVGSFAINVLASGSENVVVDHLQIVGAGLAPTTSGPAEIGINLIDTRSSVLKENILSSVNLGLFIRGGGSTGNLLEANVVTGGRTAASNLLGICYNPAAGEGDAAPSGDAIVANRITRFGTAISLTPTAQSIIQRDNTLFFFNSAYSATAPKDTVIVNDTPVKINP